MFQSLILSIVVSLFGGVQAPTGLDWTVGDKADYNINMGFIQGTMNMLVREEVDKGFWIDQDMDLGFAGKQKVEILIDKDTGAILELRVNGEKQDPPDPGEQEIVETKGTSVTVPAGTFECLYAKIRNTKDNKESEAWINPDAVPVMGMIKQVAPGPMGTVTVELTGFNFAN